MPDSFHLMEEGGQNNRLFRNGFGQTFLAHFPEANVRTLHGRLKEGPVLPLADLIERLARIRQDGICVERGEAKSSAMRIVAPVFSDKDTPVGVLGVAAFLTDGDVSGFIENVKQHASDISEQLKELSK